MTLPTHRPLETIEEGRRGRGFVLKPHCRGDKQIVAIDVTSQCPRGELIGIVLGLREKVALGSCPLFLGDGPDRFPMVRAHLHWGIGGAAFYAMADFLNGTQIGLVAEGVRVCVEYLVFGHLDDDDADPEPDEDPKRCCLPSYNISVGAGYGVRSHLTNSARLTEFVEVEPNGSACVPIPPFAISFTVQTVRDGAAAIAVISDCGGTPVRYDSGEFSPLYNGARAIVVQNPSGTDTLKAFVIFGLAL